MRLPGNGREKEKIERDYAVKKTSHTDCFLSKSREAAKEEN